MKSFDFALLELVAALVALGAVICLWKFTRQAQWVPVQVFIEQSEMTRETNSLADVILKGKEGSGYAITIRFRYEVGGTTFRSNRIVPGLPSHMNSYAAAKRTVERYPQGATTTAYYALGNPAEAALAPARPFSWAACLAFFLFVFFLLNIIAGVTLIQSGKIDIQDFIKFLKR